jgi:hypothetical protein
LSPPDRWSIFEAQLPRRKLWQSCLTSGLLLALAKACSGLPVPECFADTVPIPSLLKPSFEPDFVDTTIGPIAQSWSEKSPSQDVMSYSWSTTITHTASWSQCVSLLEGGASTTTFQVLNNVPTGRSYSLSLWAIAAMRLPVDVRLQLQGVTPPTLYASEVVRLSDLITWVNIKIPEVAVAAVPGDGGSTSLSFQFSILTPQTTVCFDSAGFEGASAGEPSAPVLFPGGGEGSCKHPNGSPGCAAGKACQL